MHRVLRLEKTYTYTFRGDETETSLRDRLYAVVPYPYLIEQYYVSGRYFDVGEVRTIVKKYGHIGNVITIIVEPFSHYFFRTLEEELASIRYIATLLSRYDRLAQKPYHVASRLRPKQIREQLEQFREELNVQRAHPDFPSHGVVLYRLVCKAIHFFDERRRSLKSKEHRVLLWGHCHTMLTYVESVEVELHEHFQRVDEKRKEAHPSYHRYDVEEIDDNG